MKNRTSPIKRFLVYATLACVVSEPVFAAVTDISNVPLSSGTTSVTPNVMYILDDSGSMARDFLPDYVAPIAFTGQTEANGVMRRSDNSFDCTPGEPCYYSGGGNGFNGIYYDPNVNYKPGVTYLGATVQPATLSTTALEPDAYLGGADVNLTNNTVSTDKVYCNPNGLCKRPGTTGNNTTLLPAGGLDFDSKSDGTSYATALGQFPYRAHRTNSSVQPMGLPEMMPVVASWTRSGGTATFTTSAPHGLAVGDIIFVTGTGNGSIDGFSRTVGAGSFTATTFQIGVANGGGTSGSAGFYRKHTGAPSAGSVA